VERGDCPTAESPLCSLTPISYTTGNSGDLQTFKAEIGIFMFAWIFGTFWPKIVVFEGKIGEGVVQCWPQRTRYYFWRCYLCATYGKIDQEMQQWECGRTGRQTHVQTQTKFITCPVLYATAMGK